MSDQQQPAGPDFKTEGLALSDLPDGGMRAGVVEGEPVMLARHGAEIFAVSGHCTHYSGPLADGLMVGTTVRCPLHHACFDLRTGEALRAPALNPLSCWEVEQREGRVYVGAKRADRDPLAPAKATSKPNVSPSSVVIIGAGAAGSAAAEMLRRCAYTGPITIVDREPDSPYDRPNLSKDYLAGDAQEEWMPLRPKGFYAEHQIDIVRTDATAIDTKRKRVQLANGQSLAYGALLLATGAEPIHLNVPGNAFSHVHVLRSFADCRVLIADAARHKRVVILGASFIGLEVAASLRKRGVRVTVVAPEKLPLERVLGKEIGTTIKALHEHNGVIFYLGKKLKEVRADSVILDDGQQIQADLVVAGIGVRPRLDLAQQAGLNIDKGVVVDAQLQTSTPDIYAAGDIARWPDPHTGASMRVEHWVVAQQQGQMAARNILGANEPFGHVPFFWTTQFGTTVSYVGHAEHWDRADVAGDLAKSQGVVAFRQGGKTLAVATMDRDIDSLRADVALERGDEAALTALVSPT